MTRGANDADAWRTSPFYISVRGKTGSRQDTTSETVRFFLVVTVYSGSSGDQEYKKQESIRIQDNNSSRDNNSMVSVVSTPVNSVEMIIDTIIERLGTNPTDVASATTMDVIAPIDLLDEDTTIGTFLDVLVTLRPPV